MNTEQKNPATWHRQRELLKMARQLLAEGMNAINDEINASGEDWKNQPIMRGHSRTADKIARFLKTLDSVTD